MSDGFVERITRVMCEVDGADPDGWRDSHYVKYAEAITEEIRLPIISMFRVMEQPGIPYLSPEARWNAMTCEIPDEDEY